MAATALHIVRKVLPDCPVRQWVLSVPFPVRRLLAADARLFGAVVKVVARVLDRFYLERARQRASRQRRRGRFPFMLPMQYTARSAAILAPPHFPLCRYHGVLAADAPWRKHVVPAPAEPDDDGCSHKTGTNSLEPAREGKRDRKRTSDLDKPPEPSGNPSLLRPSPEPVAPRSGKPSWRPSTCYVPWAKPQRHCFQQDVLD